MTDAVFMCLAWASGFLTGYAVAGYAVAWRVARELSQEADPHDHPAQIDSRAASQLIKEIVQGVRCLDKVQDPRSLALWCDELEKIADRIDRSVK